MASAIAGVPSSVKSQLTDGVQSTLEKSFSSAVTLAERYPDRASQITAAAKSSFLSGDQWAYLAGIVAVLLGAALVFVWFPKKEAEEQLIASFHAEDTAVAEREEQLESAVGS
jgi:hypothetical protein